LRLGELPVLVIDCQTTGASPARGDLLEVGWCACTGESGGDSAEAVSSALVALSPGKKIPFHITRLTGIAQADMAEAVTGEEMLKRLLSQQPTPIQCVAHYARFEIQFLQHLFSALHGETEFPFQFICTYEIGRRIFPDLPRRGLRAIAGYFGFQLTELKRAGDHTAATVAVWQALVQRLKTAHDVETLDDLKSFLSVPPPSRKGRWQYPLAREKRLALPDRPGVYRFLGRGGEVLYVGKATSLKRRVNSYYRQRRAADKTLELVSQAWDLKVTETETALEAALLEVDEIKSHEPTYNRALRDRGQEAWFFSSDLTRSGETGGRDLWIGPLPNRESLGSIHFISELLNAGAEAIADEAVVVQRLGFGTMDFEPGAVRGGLKLFAENNGLLQESAADLLHHGAVGLRVQLTEIAEAALAAAETVEEGEAGKEPTPATAEDMARYMEHQLIYGARLKRRARWLLALAESTVTWRHNSSARYLVFSKGQPGVYGSVAHGPVPAPQLDSTPTRRRDRYQWFDRPTYDRMRILMTELKRLAGEERLVEIVFAHGGHLRGPALTRLFIEL
jgi:DNA polymerase III subunit epsilon